MDESPIPMFIRICFEVQNHFATVVVLVGMQFVFLRNVKFLWKHLARKHQYNLWYSSECLAWPLSFRGFELKKVKNTKHTINNRLAITGQWCNRNSPGSLLIVFIHCSHAMYSIASVHLFGTEQNGMECDTMCHRIQVYTDLLIALLHSFATNVNR